MWDISPVELWGVLRRENTSINPIGVFHKLVDFKLLMLSEGLWREELFIPSFTISESFIPVY